MNDASFSLRLPANLHYEIMKVAKVEDRSVNKTVVMLLWAGLRVWEKYDAEITRQKNELRLSGIEFRARAGDIVGKED